MCLSILSFTWIMERIRVRDLRSGLLVKLDPKDYSSYLYEEKAKKRGIVLEKLHHTKKRVRVLWTSGEVEALWIWQLRML